MASDSKALPIEVAAVRRFCASGTALGTPEAVTEGVGSKDEGDTQERTEDRNLGFELGFTFAVCAVIVE